MSPSQPPLPEHPFMVLGVVTATSSLILLLLARLVAIRGTCLCLFLVRSGRALPSGLTGLRLAYHHAISITRSRNERRNAAIIVLATSAFYAAGEHDGQLLRACVRRVLGEISQYEDK
jgi:hypothetical protein